MAYKRKYNGSAKRGRRTRRKTRIFRPSRALVSNNVHRFKRTTELTAIFAQSAAATYGGLSFTIGSLPDVSDFTTLYDMYRINKIKVVFVPTATAMDMNAAAGMYYMPNFHTVVDYDDASAPSSQLALMQYPNYKRTQVVKQHSRYFTPAISNEVYRSAVTTSYTSQWKQWLDFAATDVPHFGLKYCMDVGNPAGGTQVGLRVYATFYFDCKGVR